MHLFGHCLNHDDLSPTLEPIMIVWTLYVVNELKPKSLWLNSTWNGSPKLFLEWVQAQHLSPSKVYTHDQHQRPKAYKMHAFQVYGQAISSKYQKIIIKVQAFQVQAQAISSKDHFIIIKVQAHQVSSILNGPTRSKWPNFASLHIWFATSWLSLKFVCLFHVSMFPWIQNFHVAFNELCLCIYI